MQFDLPPRKPSRSATPYFAPRRSTSLFRRIRPRTWIWVTFVLFCIVFLLRYGFLRPKLHQEAVPPNTPHVVIVTAIDSSLPSSYQQLVVENRRKYAARHGYETFLPHIQDYPSEVPDAPLSWSRLPATRHALAKFPYSALFWYLDQSALIANHDLSVEKHIMDDTRLLEIMLADKPVVPPDSTIKTLRHRRADRIDLVLTQDHQGINSGSFIIRGGEWAKFLLDAWYEPLYRSYNFQRAEAHAMEHVVQWHGTVLSRMIFVPQNIMNSYSNGFQEELYKDGDFVVNLKGCDSNGRSCEQEALPYLERIHASRRATPQS